jgi:hypothetical protein
MDTIYSILAVMAGVFIRLAVPLGLTGAVIFLLRKLDARWQAEAGLQTVKTPKPECWKIKNCPPERIKSCQASTSSLPCWQVNRRPNGYLREDCLTCEVFIDAPIPALNIEPRRI